MKFISFIFLFSFLSFTLLHSQEVKDPTLPYHQIPDYPESYNAGSVAARVLDGLGYRYYWATEGLREEDLNYKISEDSRKVIETIDHIRGLVRTSLLAIQGKPIERGGAKEELSFGEMRKQTLENIKIASDILKSTSDVDIESLKIIFKRGDSVNESPFWNLLNGPIADAIYHTGQIVSFRRASGNPLYPGVSVFRGKTRE